VRDWFVDNRLLIGLCILGVLLTAGVMPMHRAQARAECHRRYAKARTAADTLAIDGVVVDVWDRFPGLASRCLVVRLADRPKAERR
jgi:hypothetical protein